MAPNQYSKFKPWRKGKSSKNQNPGSTNSSGGKKMSLKNRLRGQKRLLAKIEQRGEDGSEVQKRIEELEKEVRESEVREREKKNSTKYHQVKFIERQKLTRLEKSIRRQFTSLQEEQSPSNDEQIKRLQEQHKLITLDQLYVAFYPPDVKYMSLFTNGMNRAIDDARGQKRRREIWNRIKERLDDAPTDDAWNEAKSWINLDVAKSALADAGEEFYPNAPGTVNAAVSGDAGKKVKAVVKASETKGEKGKPKADDRFVLSKEVDGMFAESTTGLDYEEKLTRDEDDSDDSSSSSSDDSSDDADPLKGFDAKSDGKKDTADSSSSSDSSDDEVEQPNLGRVGKRESSSSSSSDSDSSHSEAAPPKKTTNPPNSQPIQQQAEINDDSDEESEDDFFASEKISAAEAFKLAEKNQHKHRETNDHYYQNKKGDKSKGFSTQNQTKREFRNFQHRKKRSRLG